MSERERYFIKPGYRCNVKPGEKIMFEGAQDKFRFSRTSQYEVYEYARQLILEYKIKNVLDIGCGYGLKLKKLILPVCQDVTGIDEPSTILWCKQHHNFGTWYADNLEKSRIDLERTFDLIISADVIEHLVNPNKLLELIKRHASNKTFIILSTVERDAVRGKEDMGPPSNPFHAREWNFEEFRKYLEYKRFKVSKHFRVVAQTPLLLQSIYRLKWIRKKVERLLAIISGRKKFLEEGQIILLKI